MGDQIAGEPPEAVGGKLCGLYFCGLRDRNSGEHDVNSQEIPGSRARLIYTWRFGERSGPKSNLTRSVFWRKMPVGHVIYHIPPRGQTRC